ncbi:HypC/HybG/HupF family hydrogenase formation chaperone [Ktedonosporobacter rubrisoli]|uniref:HypC/HybG/HupF family hydrogenase formation chaperone n=1 Tax=Ktedonosporobacter rubrisoli TaxID=2509675 RepID=A0A4P6K300_KTERU|nr:HypC/HybG/HupF family hydrogenase formation chaperone [Ktedonosporobacter rubrisoli]QBD82539.1 HypC/HybG/HupF family hydrogenase formation chaperone [Ktedonosporobacter rubrisoli]
MNTNPQSTSLSEAQWACTPDGTGHCLTCADEARPARVLHVERETSLATVAIGEAREEIDISLVEEVGPGVLVLVHGGVAIAQLDEDNHE